MGPARKRVLELLGDGSGQFLINTVADETNTSYSTARVHLRELRKLGLVTRVNRYGRYFYSRSV